MTGTAERMRVGILGMGRAACFIGPVMSHPHAALAAVCDRIPEKPRQALAASGADCPDVAIYSEYEEMLDKSRPDIVIIGSGWADHVPQSVMALERGIHVFSEVPAAWNLEHAKELAAACRRSRAVYSMGENCCYDRQVMAVGGMIRDGLLGYVHYAEGEYIHDCRHLLDTVPWRKQIMYSVNGLLYMTHETGPILSWFGWDRIVRVCAAGSGSHFYDADGRPFAQETRLTMQCKTAKDRLIRLCQDFQSPGGHHHRYVVQGTRGCYESGHREGIPSQFVSTALPGADGRPVWRDLCGFEAKYLPAIWERLGGEAARHSHGGTDYLVMRDFLDAIWEGRPAPLDVWKSLDMSLPGIMSVESLRLGGAWVDVPDPREWRACEGGG